MIVVEGVVGVGKTSLMELLVKKGYIPFREPIIDNPILDKFYYNRKRYAFPLQVFFLNKRFDNIKRAEYLEKIVMDRSIYGDRIFAKMLNKNKELSDEEYQIYIELLENILNYVKPPKLLIYLEISTEEAVRRINIRGRDYEQEVEREYWDTLNKEYQDYFANYNLSPILKINIDNLDFKNNIKDQELVILMIENKLRELERPEGSLPEPMNRLFEINVKIDDETKATRFISYLKKNGFVKKHKNYIDNYINSSPAIAFNHIRLNYKLLVCQGDWTENKFQDVMLIIIDNKKYFSKEVFIKYGKQYDNDKIK